MMDNELMMEEALDAYIYDFISTLNSKVDPNDAIILTVAMDDHEKELCKIRREFNQIDQKLLYFALNDKIPDNELAAMRIGVIITLLYQNSELAKPQVSGSL